MSPPNLDVAIIAAMQAEPNATQRTVRKAVGGTEHYFSEAVKRLRYAGKIQWDCFKLSPSMQPKISPAAVPLPPAAVKAKDGAGNARRVKRVVPDRSTPAKPLPAPSTLADQVKAEATDKAQRRATARKISTANTPLPLATETLADRFRRLAREVDEEEAEALAEMEAQERRDRELERLPSPSAVLRRAKRDWPAQCECVQALAAELGVSLGEAWRRVIQAGVDCMRESSDGEGVVA